MISDHTKYIVHSVAIFFIIAFSTLFSGSLNGSTRNFTFCNQHSRVNLHIRENFIISISELRKQPGKKGDIISISGYYKQNDCPSFNVTWLSKSDILKNNMLVKDDGVVWFYSNNDKSGNSGFWRRENLQSVDIRQTGAIGDLKNVETSKTKTIATGDGKTTSFSFAPQERIKPGTYKIIYTDETGKKKIITDINYGDETGLLIADNYIPGESKPVGIVYYVTGRVEGADLGDWGKWMQSLKIKAATVNAEAVSTTNELLGLYNIAQSKQLYTDLLKAALAIKPAECLKYPGISATRYYTATPVKSGLSPFGDTLFAPADIILPSVPKKGSPIQISYTAITYTGTYNLPDGRTNTQAIQTALDSVQRLIIPSVADLQKTNNNSIGFFTGTCFVPGNRIIEGSGKNTCARLQYFYDTSSAYDTRWLNATVKTDGTLQFIKPQMVTSDSHYQDQNFNPGAANTNLAIFSNKLTGTEGGNIIFKGLCLVGIGETAGSQYYDCYWGMDRKYQNITWNHEALKQVNEPVRLSQHNINMIEVPNVTITDCSSSWALEDGAYFSTYTAWQIPATAPDYKMKDVNIGAIKNIKIINCSFLNNGRNGSFVTGGDSINVSNNFYNYNQLGCLFDRPGVPQNFPSGSLAFEEHNPNQYLENLVVENNKVYNSFGEGGHFLGNGKGIKNFIHQSNLYYWDYADWYSTINLFRAAVAYATRIMNVSDSKNKIINSPALGIISQLDLNHPDVCSGNTFSNDTIINCGRHAIEIKHSPQMSLNNCLVNECGWRVFTGQHIDALILILGNCSGKVKGMNIEGMRKADMEKMEVKAFQNLTPHIEN